MTHYYSRESKTRKGEFTIMQVANGKESLVARTPRGDMAAHLVTQLNLTPLPVAKKVLPKVGDRVALWGKSDTFIRTIVGLPGGRVGLMNPDGFITADNAAPCYNSLEALSEKFKDMEVVK